MAKSKRSQVARSYTRRKQKFKCSSYILKKIASHLTLWRDIVAVHGAGIGPLLYRPVNRSPLKLLEILSPGHMTKFYRGVAHQIGARWVRVRLDSKQIQAAYDFNKPFLAYSLDDFYLDLDSLELALTQLNQPIT